MGEISTLIPAVAITTEKGRRPGRARALTHVAIATMACALAAGGAFASPAAAGPVLKLRSYHTPTNIPPGGTTEFKMFLSSDGDAATDPSDPITAVIALPEGLTAVSATDAFGGFVWICSIAPDGRTVTCDWDPFAAVGPLPQGQEACQSFGEDCSLTVTVSAALGAPSAGSLVAEVCGGGAAVCAVDADPMPVSSTPAEFGIHRFDGHVYDRNGASTTQAGSHPWAMSTRIEFNTTLDSSGDPTVPESAKTVEVGIPPGMVVNPTATPTRCSRETFALDTAGTGTCPVSSQVGIARVRPTVIHDDRNRYPIFNLEPREDVAAQFGFSVQGVPVILNGGVDPSGDYRLTATVRNISQRLPLAESTIILWGVPADPAHDVERGTPAGTERKCSEDVSANSCPVDAPLKPFLTTPTNCSATSLTSIARADSWENPGSLVDASFSSDVTGAPVAFEGCDELPFAPAITVQPTNPKPDSPSGYEIELTLPQSDEPNGLSTSHLRKAVVVLPEGVSVNPSSAHGLGACSSTQIALGSSAEPTCPDSSKIGTVEVDTPLLDNPLTGSVYVAKQTDNPFNSLLAIYIVASGSGVTIKLPGKVDPDPATGQLTTTFDNNPQLPFSSFRVTFKGGATAPLANPQSCGPHAVSTALTPWSSATPASPPDSFMIDCPGVSGFAPLFDAGTLNAKGGAFSPFAVRIERPDGHQYVRGLTIETPPGLIAKLKNVPLCPEAQAAAGTCAAETRVGTATVGAGAGPNPYFLQGPVSLTGPYKGAPYGLSVSVRAVAGPYDLGTVVVRQAVFVDPIDAHLTVISDPLPVILEGIPLRLRSINVDIDRPGFMLNPTSCGEKRIKAALTSAAGATSEVVQRFQVGDCRAMRFRPRLKLSLLGRRQTSDGEHPRLRAVLRQRAGQANLKRVAVKLPLSLALDPDNARSLCEFEDGLKVSCPASSIIGKARAITPMLNRPLEGPVYFVKGVRIDPRTGRRIRTLPTLLIPLRGEVAIDLRAATDVRRGKLVTTFAAVPDAPIRRFDLTLKGKRGGVLVVTAPTICRGKQVAGVKIDGQNGRRADSAVRMRTPCPKRRSNAGRRRPLERVSE